MPNFLPFSIVFFFWEDPFVLLWNKDENLKNARVWKMEGSDEGRVQVLQKCLRVYSNTMIVYEKYLNRSTTMKEALYAKYWQVFYLFVKGQQRTGQRPDWFLKVNSRKHIFWCVFFWCDGWDPNIILDAHTLFRKINGNGAEKIMHVDTLKNVYFFPKWKWKRICI